MISVNKGGSPTQKGFQKLLTPEYWNDQFSRYTPRDTALAFGAAVAVCGEVIAPGPLKGIFIPLLLLFSLTAVGLAFIDGIEERYRRWVAAVFAGAIVTAIPLQAVFAETPNPGGNASCATGLMADLAQHMEQIITSLTDNAEFAAQACLIFQLLAVLIVVAVIGSFIYLIFQIRDGSEFRTAANPLLMVVFVVVGILLTSGLVLGT